MSDYRADRPVERLMLLSCCAVRCADAVGDAAVAILSCSVPFDKGGLLVFSGRAFASVQLQYREIGSRRLE